MKREIDVDVDDDDYPQKKIVSGDGCGDDAGELSLLRVYQ